MRWEDEPYVKLYTRNTLTWKRLGWQGRLVLFELFRHVDRAGLLDVGMFEAVPAVAALIDVPEEIVAAGWTKILETGSAVLCRGKEGLVVFLPNYVEAQKARQSDAARQRKSRETAASLARLESITVCDTPSRSDPIGHKSGENVTSRRDPLAEKRSTEEEAPAPAETPPARPHEGTTGKTNGKTGKTVSLDAERCRSAVTARFEQEFQARSQKGRKFAWSAADRTGIARLCTECQDDQREALGLLDEFIRRMDAGESFFAKNFRPAYIASQVNALRLPAPERPRQGKSSGNGHAAPAEPRRVPGARETDNLLDKRRDFVRGVGRQL